MTKPKTIRRNIVSRLKGRRYELTALAVMSAATACANENSSVDGEKIGSSKSAVITSAQGTAAAQKAIDFMVPNAIQFTQDNGCLSCHRQPDTLISASIAAQLLPGITLDTSATTGTGYIENLVINTQQSDGSWTNGGGDPQSMSAEALWALAGYARSGGSINGLPSIKKGLLYLVPLASTTTFPNDAFAFAGQKRTYLSNDFTDSPQMWDWYLPTAQSVYATRVLLDLDSTLSAADVSTLAAQQSSYTDALEGTTMRALSSTTVQHLALTGIAMAESGRAATPDAQAIGNELIARQTSGSGWADPTLPDGTLQVVNTLTTGQALYALCRLGIRPRANASVGDGLDWLYGQLQDDGEWLLPTHNSSVSSSWALLAVACASNPSGTAEFNPLTANGSPSAPVTESFTSTLNVTNTGSDARTASIAVTGGPPGAIINVSPSSLNLAGDANAQVTLTITLPAGLPASTSYPFTATVSFAAAGSTPASQVTATFTTAIGATPDPTLTGTTTTFSNPPTQADLGGSIPLTAGVVGSNQLPVTVGSLTFSIDNQAIATVSASGNSFPATWSIPTNLSVGQHTLHAAYLGSSGAIVYAPSGVDQIINILNPPPPPPVVSGVTDGSTSTSGVYSLSGSGKPGDTIAISANGVVVRTATIGADGTWGVSFALSPGAYAISTVETGLGGSSAPTIANVSVQPSAPTVGGPAPGTTFTSMMQQVSGIATPGATINVMRGGVVVGTAVAGDDGSYSIGVTLVPGPNNLTVSQTVNGQTGALSGVVYNETPSAPSVGSPSAATSGQTTSTTTITGTTVPGATVILTDNGVVIGSAIADSNGSYAIPATLSLGKNSMSVTSSVGGIPGAPSRPFMIRFDNEAPLFLAPSNDLVAYAPTTQGVAVSWPAISAYDAQDGQITASCERPSGSIFPIGSSLVACVASDSMGNTSATTFKVNVTLQTPPTIEMPQGKSIVVKTAIATGANVSFDVTAKSVEGEQIAAVCAPASGSFFAAGTTTVNCTATDPVAKAIAKSSFDVTVIPVPYYGATAKPNAAAPSSMDASGGCNMSHSSGTTDLTPLAALGLAIAAARRRRKQNGVDSVK
jgi:MYXO-CTERM domain-containing protein